MKLSGGPRHRPWQPRICERELGQLRPERFPSTLELHRDPGAVATITQLEAAAP